MNKNITLVPVGIVESELLSWLARRLFEVLAQKVVIAEKLPLPSAGYDRRRQQYQGAATDECEALARCIGIIFIRLKVA